MHELIDIKQNILLVARERGKIVDRRETHNIFLDTGGDWLANLCSYATLPSLGVAPTHPGDAAEYHRVRYIGFGIGGTAQTAPSYLFAAAPFDAHPWDNHTFTQTDDDPEVYALESPVPVKATANPSPNDYQWLGQIVAPPDKPATRQVRYSRLFTAVELTFGGAAVMPLSEVGLFTNAAAYDLEPSSSGPMIAYDTFSTLNKTNAIEIEIEWTFRF